MYKFTNGIVVFDEETKNEYLKAGFVLEKQDKKDEPIEGQISIDEAIENENTKDNSIISKKSKASKRVSE